MVFFLLTRHRVKCLCLRNPSFRKYLCRSSSSILSRRCDRRLRQVLSDGGPTGAPDWEKKNNERDALDQSSNTKNLWANTITIHFDTLQLLRHSLRQCLEISSSVLLITDLWVRKAEEEEEDHRNNKIGILFNQIGNMTHEIHFSFLTRFFLPNWWYRKFAPPSCRDFPCPGHRLRIRWKVDHFDDLLWPRRGHRPDPKSRKPDASRSPTVLIDFAAERGRKIGGELVEKN